MTQNREPGLAKAELHYRSARQYRELSQIVMATTSDMVERNILAAGAGALLYEAAKQLVNAVANLHGQDPKGNREKLSEIHNIVAGQHTEFDLLDGATAAWRLHIHADQFNLTPDVFNRNLTTANEFIAEMQAIYENIRRNR